MFSIVIVVEFLVDFNMRSISRYLYAVLWLKDFSGEM